MLTLEIYYEAGVLKCSVIIGKVENMCDIGVLHYKSKLRLPLGLIRYGLSREEWRMLTLKIPLYNILKVTWMIVHRGWGWGSYDRDS